MRTETLTMIAIAIVGIVSLWSFKHSMEDELLRCTLVLSRDTCFHALNR